MRVTLNNKTLYHIQIVSEYSDDPIDMFVFSNNEPTRQQVRHLAMDELSLEEGDSWLTDISNNYNTYTVYATTLED